MTPQPVDVTPARGRQTDNGRRTRIAAEVDPQLRAWLHRIARVHAHLCQTVRLYGRPDRAGGKSNHGDTYAERAARGDRTLLFDCCSLGMDELAALREEIQRHMDDTPATHHPPGTTGKVAEMERRAACGQSLFNPADARVDQR
jgi:hypothetical protein